MQIDHRPISVVRVCAIFWNIRFRQAAFEMKFLTHLARFFPQY
jgi:hypothetical protein